MVGLDLEEHLVAKLLCVQPKSSNWPVILIVRIGDHANMGQYRHQNRERKSMGGR